MPGNTRPREFVMISVVLLGLSVCAALAAQAPLRQIPVPPPPMGWSSWNSFSNTVNSQIITEQAKAMAANGMQKAGYQYINIDEGWWLGQRDADGNFVIDGNAWPPIALNDKPGEMGNIVRFIHALGLKAGIYTDAGKDGCSMFPDLGPALRDVGSEGHYEQDFLQFARWGFDYVKVDWCGGDKEKLDPAVQYAEISRAIANAERVTGHRLYLSICNWGNQSPWTWAPHVGGAPADLWRTSGDIVDPIVESGIHRDRKASFDKMLANFDQGIHPEAEHTGFYNDPDMMVIGMPGLTDAQNRVHMSLWAISGAPLLVGADLAKLTPATLAMLTNASVLAVDQDTLGMQGIKVAEPAKGLEVWSKVLAKPGSRAVLLLNRTTDAQEIALHWKDLGLIDQSNATVKDLWTGEELNSFGSYSVKVPAGDAVFARVEGTEAAWTTYHPDPAATRTPCHNCDLRFSKVGARASWVLVRITYSNSDKTSRFAALRINGQDATQVAFPPTGSTPATIVVQAQFDRTGTANALTFSPDCDAMPAISAVEVQ